MATPSTQPTVPVSGSRQVSDSGQASAVATNTPSPSSNPTSSPEPSVQNKQARSIRMPLTDVQIANIVFNETRSLSGENIERTRINIAHTIINANSGGHARPRTGPITAQVPDAEAKIYADCIRSVQLTRDERSQGVDPTNGAMNFNFRPNTSRGDFYNLPLQTQSGPLKNSYPTPELPKSGIYGNTYGK